MLGARLRYEQYDDAHANILAVQDVYLGSPAYQANLVPFMNYILGTRELTFRTLADFAKYVSINKGQEI